MPPAAMVRPRLADIQFLVIDSRRGTADDKQHEKVLAVYPPVQDGKLLLWAVGLHLGTHTFAQSTGQVRRWFKRAKGSPHAWHALTDGWAWGWLC